MPPRKILKVGNVSMDPKIPRVILHPLRAQSSHSRYRYNAAPPTASLFKKPELSDIKLKVGDQTFYAHKLILCAGSEVFARMLGSNWAESNSSELELLEDEEGVKVFERFLYYFYTGSIVISENYVIPLFMLADKYNVKPVYDECVKQIENGLKVYVITKNTITKSPKDGYAVAGTSAYNPATSFMLSSSSSCSDSSDSESSETGQQPTSTLPEEVPQTPTVQQPQQASSVSNRVPSTGCFQTTHLVATEAFPLTLVMKMLLYCQNDRVTSAALYNLEARLTKHILHENYALWNDLDKDLVVKLLSDTHFYCNEHVLYRAAKSWLQYIPERQTKNVLSEVLECIRYPLLEPAALYEVEKDEIIELCPSATTLVREAIRYKLFKNCSQAAEQEEWTGIQFIPRQVKEF